MLAGALLAFALRSAGALVAFAFTITIARQLGANGVGLYTLAFTIASVAAALAQLGFPPVLLRFVAIAAGSRTDSEREVLQVAVRWSMAAAISLMAIVALAAGPISESLFSEPELAGHLRLMALAIPPMTFITLQGEALKALNRVAHAQFVQSLAGTTISLLILVALVGVLTVDVAVIAHLVGVISAAGVGALFWSHFTARSPDGSRLNPQARQAMSRMARPLYVSAIMLLVMTFADTIVIGAWHDADEVGAYHVAVRVATLSTMVLSAVNSVVAPRFATLWAHRQFARTRDLLLRSTVITAAAAIAINVPIMILAEPILELFGQGFGRAAPALALLALGQLAVLATGPVVSLLAMTGRERRYRDIIMLGATVNLGLNLLFVPAYAAVGAAAATATSLVIMNLVACWMAWNHVKIAVESAPART